MKTKIKNRLFFLFAILVVLLAFAFWYSATYSMEVAENSETNSPQLAAKILIATQGSDFKEAIVTNITNFYSKDSVYLKTIDVSQLQQAEPQQYHVIIILHTWEYGKAPQTVTRFINENKRLKNKMIVYATSGAGTNKIEGIDAMAGESILENASDVSDTIIEKIEDLLQQQTNL